MPEDGNKKLRTRRQMRNARRRGDIALGLVITVVLGAATGVVIARSDAPAAAGTIRRAPVVERNPGIDDPRWRPVRPVPLRSAVSASRRRPAEKTTRVCGQPGARLVKYRVSVEGGLDITKRRFAEQVVNVLCDERSWIASGRVRFQYDPDASTLVSLRSATSTERRCLDLIGLSVRLKWSCASRAHGEAVLNADRWFGGSPSWPGSVGRYRHMLVNHEVGHLLGQGHRSCSGDGKRAPVMMQQSKGLKGCASNPWPLDSELASIR